MTKELLNYFKGDELAAGVWQSKYAAEGEKTPDDMHKRMAKEFTRIEEKYIKEELKLLNQKKIEKNLSDYVYKRTPLNEDSIYKLFKNFKFVVPQGSIMATLGTKSIASLSNCWVAESPLDSYGGILKTDGDLAYYYKRRGGVGTDISNLRPKNTKTNNTSKSSTGAVSFMHRYSNTTREVAMNGRRGALMLSIDVNHPDVLDFIKIKRDGTSVTGANVSVRLNRKFMEAVKNEEDYILKFPCDKNFNFVDTDSLEYNKLTNASTTDGVTEGYVKKIKAKQYWDELIYSAKNHAEPGLLYWDNALDYDPASVYEEFKPVCTNPCFVGDTQILTYAGYKNIKDCDGEEIFINKDGKIVNGIVWSNGVKDIIQLSLSNGTKIKCTPDHKFMTNSCLEQQAHTLKGHRLMPYYTINKEVSEFTKYGFIQGDGGLNRLNSQSHKGLEINIGKDDNDIFELFNIEKEEGKRSYYTNGFNEILRSLKFDASELPKRNFPGTYLFWNKQDKLMFLKGMYSANGSIIKKQRIAYKTTSKQLASELLDTLSSFGITSYITTNKKREVEFSNGTYICKESYDINISRYKSVIKFAELIGFVHKYKQDALETLILSKAPKVLNIKESGQDEVFDFSLDDDTHWGVVEGVIAHNCGEQFLNANDSCRLMVLVLLSMVDNPFTEDAKINKKRLYTMAYEFARLGDDLVDLELEYIQRIINKIKSDPEPERFKRDELELWETSYEKTKAGRRVGLGITGLGDMLAALGLAYDSDEGIDMIEEVMSIKKEAELDCTIDLAILRGAFNGWDREKEFPNSNNTNKLYGNGYYYFLQTNYAEQVKRMKVNGRRNVSWSTIAPTGSVSLLTQTTSGCEPLFMPFYMRRKKINPSEEGVRVDFVDDIGDSWEEYPVLHEQFKKWVSLKYTGDSNISLLSKDTLQMYFEKSPWYKSTANDIDWIKRNKIQAILQKYTTNAISSTINLPSTVSEKEVSDIYMSGWEMGLKGQTVYVDGSRSGVLVDNNSKENKNSFDYHDAPKRPKKLKAEVNTLTALGQRFTVIVGLMDDKPYEIFVEEGDDIVLEKGKIIKKKKGVYVIEGNIKESNITQALNLNLSDEELALTRMISTALRHGANIKFIVEQLNKSNGTIVSFSKAIARTLKKYIPNGEKSTVSCLDCGSDNVIFEEGCSKCKDCGSSKCG